jgi:predicted Zn-dependent protease
MLRYVRAVARGLAYPARAAGRRPWLTLTLAGLLLAAGVAATSWYVQYQWEQAQADLAAGRYAEARSRLEVCLFVCRWDPEVRRLAARAARLSGDIHSAEKHLKECLKLQGKATQAVQLEFLLLRLQMGELDDVVPTLVDCVEKKHPESPLILETLAGAYILRFRFKAAYAFLTSWIELQPQAARPYQLRGAVLERLNQHRKAAEDYRLALERDPNLLPVRLRLAEILLEEKRAPEALPHLERLHRQHPNHPEVQARLGIARFFQNKPDEARRLMEAAVVHLPKDPPLLIYLARLDLEQGRGAEAERRLRTVLRADPSDTEALHTLISVLQLQNRPAEAAATLKEYQRAKQRVDRVNHLLRGVVDSPDAKTADYVELGDLLLQVGRDRQGVYWLGQALERDPGHPGAHKLLVAYYEKTGDREHAQAHRRWLRGPAVSPGGSDHGKHRHHGTKTKTD